MWIRVSPQARAGCCRVREQKEGRSHSHRHANRWAGACTRASSCHSFKLAMSAYETCKWALVAAVRGAIQQIKHPWSYQWLALSRACLHPDRQVLGWGPLLYWGATRRVASSPKLTSWCKGLRQLQISHPYPGVSRHGTGCRGRELLPHENVCWKR